MPDMLFKALCAQCKGAFNNCGEVYGTSCGHLFHSACLNDHRSRGSICPQCNRHAPYPYKLYFSFEGPDDAAEKKAEAELKLKKSTEKITRLRVEVSESETNFFKLQKQISEIEDSKKALKNRIKEIEESEGNFMQLQGQYTETAERVKELECRISHLTIENEGKSKELLLKRLENEMLKVNLDAEPTTTFAGSVLSEKVKFVEKKLLLMSQEFEKEIATSTQLSIDKMKLNSLLSHLQSLEQTAKPAAAARPIDGRKRRSREDFQKERQHITPNSSDNHNCILVKGLPMSQIAIPLENSIVNLASKMQLSISADDLIKVNFVDNKEASSSKPILLAQFKCNQLKDKFLSKKNILKSNPATQTIIMSEFMSEEIVPLFKYAKEKLPMAGFRCIYCKDNRIYAKKERTHRNAIHIESKAEVDNMIEHLDTAAGAMDNLSIRGDVDENFYQL